ncbi:hypothetical protein HY947_02555 [Candidatus Gottesmanbacteria bacterium]|nr:hypothetical protein [Candidatus Gottesmanbacteria bacterium]
MKHKLTFLFSIIVVVSLLLAACATPAPTLAPVVSSVNTPVVPSTPIIKTNASPVPAKDTSTPMPAPDQNLKVYDPITVDSGQGAKNYKTIPPTVQVDPKEEEKYLDPVKKVFDDGTLGFVTDVSPTGDFVRIVTGVDAEGWVAKKTIKKVASVTASGNALFEINVLPTKDAKVDIVRVIAYSDNIYKIILRDHASGDIIRLDIERKTVYYGPSDGTATFRFNFECANHAPRTYSFSMNSYEARNSANLVGRSAPQINPCKP